jgi:phage terminase small subunit
MPNPKKPPTLKIIAGTSRPDRDDGAAGEADFATLTEIPAPPNWLPNAHAINEWRRLGGLLVANKLLVALDLSTLGQLCALHGKMVQLYAAGETPVASMVAQYSNLASAFGLAPTWRSKVKVSGESNAGGRFGKFKKGATSEG